MFDCPVPGVVAVVVSDDCAFNSLLLKVIPALAMGNTHAKIITYFVSLIRLKPYLIIILHFQVFRDYKVLFIVYKVLIYLLFCLSFR